ncbi:MAG TPA: glycosyltransferase [Terriglobia bacterium]
MISGLALRPFFDWTFLLSFAYLMLLYAFTLFMAIVAMLENRRRTAESHTDDYDALSDSRFTIPVSVIVPVYNEQGMIGAVVRRLLAFEYPEFEIVVVNDGSKDETLGALRREFVLQSVSVTARRLLQTSPVRAIYRSRTDPRLIVIDKCNGGKADALNCGVNFARDRYICCVDGDAAYEPDALLVAMRPAIKDPAGVLGITSIVAVRHELQEEAGEIGNKNIDRHLWINFQHLEILRSFLNNRLAWSRMNIMLCASGAFAIWRRDVVLEVGGFSPAFTCEDLEMTVRVLERYKRDKRPGRVLSLPDIVGATEGPERLTALISQRARWQRVILETVWHYRRVLFRPRYGALGFVGLPYLIISECFGPFVQLIVLASLGLGLWLRLVDLKEFFSLLGIQVLALGIMSEISLWLNESAFHYYRVSALTRMALIAPLDLLLYRPILVYANAKGVVQFLRGDRSWDRFARNVGRMGRRGSHT